MHQKSMKLLPAAIAAALLAAAVLSACGDGSDASSTGAPDSPAPPKVSTANISGTVATGKPLVGATVQLNCANGSTTATTDANGAYSTTFPFAIPCAVSATSSDKTLVLHSLLTTGGVANVTPLTETLMNYLAGQLGTDAKTLESTLATNTTFQQTLTSKPSILTAAQTAVLNLAISASSSPLSSSGSFLTTAFVANGKGADLDLDVLKTSGVVDSTGQVQSQLLASANSAGRNAPIVTPTPTATPTGVVTPTPTGVVTPTPTGVVTPTPTGVVTPTPTGVVTPTPTGVVTPTPTGVVTPTPTGVVTPNPSSACGVAVDASALTRFSALVTLNDKTLDPPFLLATGADTKWTFDSALTASGTQMICGYASTAGSSTAYDSTTTVTGSTLTGGIALSKAAVLIDTTVTNTQKPDDGGKVVFRLPSLNAMQITVSATGGISYRVESSTNGTDWTVQTAAVTHTKGQYTDTLSTPETKAPVWVRLSNAGTGTLYIQQLKITP